MTEYRTVEHKGKGCTVRVHIPILTEDEQNKRDKAIELALIQFAKERRMKR